MRRLFPVLPFHPCETPLSFAARLASLHTGGRVTPFLRDLGIRPEDLRIGASGAVERLAEAAGVDPVAFGRNALVATGRQRYRLRGEAITAEFLASPETLYCPACLLADDAASRGAAARIGRLEWTLRVVRTCPDHRLALVRKPKIAWDDVFNELAVRAPTRAADLAREVDTASRRKPSLLQTYVTDRLDGAAGPAWLDAQSLENAVWVCEMLGIVLLRGPKADLRSASEDDRDRAGALGFGFAARGEEGITEALATLHAKHRYAGGKPGPQRIFGRLYTAMASKKAVADRGDIRRIMRAFILDAFEMPAGAIVLGEALPLRRLHSVASLAAETGLDNRTLRGVLTACGVIPEDRAAALDAVFDADEGRRVAAGMVRQVSLRALPERLNCARPLAEQIVDERILVPLAGLAGSAVNRTSKAFDEAHVVALLTDLRVVAWPATNVRDLCSIAKAAERAKVRAVDVLHLILGGHLTAVVRIEGVDGVAAIRVDPTEVKRMARALMTDLSPSEAFRALRIPVRSGWALIDGAGDGVHLPHRRIVGPDDRHAFVRIRRDDVDMFAASYTTVVRIADAIGLTSGEVASALRADRIPYCAKRRRLGVDLIRCADLPPSLAA